MGRTSFNIHWGLYPFSLLFGIGVGIRNWLFDRKVLPSRHFPMPVISVGNLTVGGTGKTPHTEYLIRLLQPHGQIAVLSRGYRRRSKGFVMATPDTPSSQIGDEPYQMAHKFPGICMAVDRNRCQGIERLMHELPNLQAVLLDDAYQHRHVSPGLSILLIDYNRPAYQDVLLPAGRLREPMSGKQRADIIIVSKCPGQMGTDERQAILQQIAPLPHQHVFFTSLVYGQLRPVFPQLAVHRTGALTPDESVLLLTGIASPAAILTELGQYTHRLLPLTFADHHAFTAADMKRLKQLFEQLPEGKRLIVTTEKDAARLIDHLLLDEALKPFLYVLPVEVSFLFHQQEQFNQNIIEYVRKNPRNSRLPEG